MQTALDDPPGDLDEDETHFVGLIREHGWFAHHIFADEEHPGFSYSTGFWLTLREPEILLFSLKRNIAHEILWDVFRDLEAGVRFPIGLPKEGLFGNARGCLFPVSKAHYQEHLGWSRWFYRGDDFPCLQLVWTDPSGVFPWQPGFDEEFREDQPDLTEHGWLAALSH